MCDCKSTAWEVGSIPSAMLTPPKGLLHKDTVFVDDCLKHVITHLWLCGVKTFGCCCGHNRQRPWVGVSFKEYNKDEIVDLIHQVDSRDFLLT